MTQMDKGELLAHHNIHFETHMEVYERSSSIGLGAMVTNGSSCWRNLGFSLPNFAHSKPKTWHDMTQMDKGELLAHHNIRFETHMEVYERSISSGLGAMVTTCPTLWGTLNSVCQILPTQSQKHGMT
jgi:hypothetical protein